VASQVNLSENDVSSRVMKRVQESLSDVAGSGCEVTLQSDTESAVSEESGESSDDEEKLLDAVSESMASLAVEKHREAKVLDVRGPRGALTGEAAIELVKPIMRCVSLIRVYVSVSCLCLCLCLCLCVCVCVMGSGAVVVAGTGSVTLTKSFCPHGRSVSKRQQCLRRPSVV
jgi:hypothetical protein